VALAAALLGGCVTLAPARVELPGELRDRPAETLQGLGGERDGRFTVAGLDASYARSADRLALFSESIVVDKAWARATLRHDDGRQAELDCRARQTAVSRGIVGSTPQPWSVACSVQGATRGELTLTSEREAAGTREARRGQWRREGTTLELRSLHRWEGAALPSPTPAGYLLLDAGRPVGAIEAQGPNPRAWLPPRGMPLRDDVLYAVTALALLWAPE
jgi:hypothetical protein